jgi:hypothetical protein
VVVNTGKALFDNGRFVGYEPLEKITKQMLETKGDVKKGVVHVACLWWEHWEAGGGAAPEGQPPNYSSFHGANFGKLSNFNYHASKCAGCKLALQLTSGKSLAPGDIAVAAALAQKSADVQRTKGKAHEATTMHGTAPAATAASTETHLILLEYPEPKLQGLESFDIRHGDLDDSVLCDGGLYKESTVNLLVLHTIISAGKEDSILFFSTRLCALISTEHRKALDAFQALPEAERNERAKINLMHEGHMDLLVKLTAQKKKQSKCDVLGHCLSRLIYGPTPDAIVAVHHAHLHYSLAAISLSGVQFGIDKVQSFHLNSHGASHFIWAKEILQPFLITAINHALSLKVEVCSPRLKAPLCCMGCVCEARCVLPCWLCPVASFS